MTKVIEIAYTAYPVTDMARARKFYEGVFGLKATSVFENDGRSWVEYDIGPGTLALTDMTPEWTPSPMGAGAALEVADFGDTVAALKGAGAKFLYEPFESPVCHMAVALDSEGNAICIHKRKAG